MPQSGLTKKAYDVQCDKFTYLHMHLLVLFASSTHGHKLFKIKHNLELCFAGLWSVNLKQQYCEYLETKQDHSN
jgi:hypothetical protein